MISNKPFSIGIDGGTHTGFAVYDNESKEFVAVKTLNFWAVYDFITKIYTPENALIVIEYLPPKQTVYARVYSATQKGRDRFNQNVGSVKRETSLLIERFESLGYEVRKVKPIKAKKWTAEQFQRYTGWKEKTSQHGRDAARLIYFY